MDYVVYYNHDTKKLDLYVYTGHEVQLLYEVDMHTNTMNNFYQTTYACSGASVTVKSATYKTYDTDINTIFNELNLELKEHKYVDVEVTSATCSTDGVVAHKACIMCDAKVDMEGNPITDAQTEVMWGHTYATDTNTCTVCGKENPLTVHATHTYNGAEKWDYTDAYFTHVIHENIKYNSVDGNGALYDFSESIKYVGWGSNAYAYTLKLSSSSNVVTVSFGGNTYTLEEEYVNQLKSENGLDLFVSFEKTTKALKVYARNSTGVNELISFVCYDSKAAGFYETSITAHNENVTVNSTIYKVTGEFDAASDLKNL